MRFPTLTRAGLPGLRLPFGRRSPAGAVTSPAGDTVEATPAGTSADDATLAAPVPVIEAEDVRILRRTRLRLMALSGVVTLAILMALGLTVYSAVSNIIVNDSVTKLQDKAGQVANVLSGSPPPSPRTLNRDWGTRFSDVYVYFAISSTGGGYITGETEGHPPGMPVQAAITAVTPGKPDMRQVVIPEGAALRVYTTTGQATFEGATHQFVVQTAVDRTEEINLLALLRIVLILGSLAALLLALAAGYFYAGRALVPIRSSMTRREAALKRQREFAANASHELRTPLTVIGASVEDLKRNRRSRVEDVGEALEDIDAEVRHMTALVEDLLLLARTDSGVVQVEKMPVDLADVAVESVSTLAFVAQEKDARLEVDPLPALVLGDQLRLRQLVTILADNAIKHTRPGTTVRVHVHPDATAAILRVDDEGPGVRPEDAPRIFERFWRADDAPVGGTGLGLSIAKWIVEKHGGVIGVVNRPEGGATFWARLPLYRPSPLDAGPLDAGPPKTQVPDPQPLADATEDSL